MCVGLILSKTSHLPEWIGGKWFCGMYIVEKSVYNFFKSYNVGSTIDSIINGSTDLNTFAEPRI